MIPYHHALDAHHCCFRIACLMHDGKIPKMEVDRLRLLDFYFVFPQCAIDIEFPRHLVRLRKLFHAAPRSYEDVSNSYRIFGMMCQIQNQAVHALIGLGMISSELYLSTGAVEKTPKAAFAFDEIAKNNHVRKDNWYQAIVSELALQPLLGPDGLKARSGLLEYRYDII